MTDRTASAADFASLKVAIVHDWYVGYFGAERVIEQIHSIFPQADLYALIDFLPTGQRQFIGNKKVRTSFLQKLPRAKKKYRSYLPLMPLAIEQFDMSPYDLVISNSYAVAKGVICGPDQLHVCMCHSPVRYAWDLMHQYLEESGLTRGIRSWLARVVLHYLRLWDFRSAAGVDEFIANSRHIARRIEKVYRRSATVIYPPVDVGKFKPDGDKDDFYLTASRMVPYKRIGMIVQAFGRMPDKRLIVIGDGPELKKVKRKPPRNVEILGYQDSDSLIEYMQKARGFVFAACEDFGIVPVEAMACGTPVIAYGRGGILETVIEGKTGIFFHEQTPDAIVDAVERFERIRNSFDPQVIRANSQRFSLQRFKDEFRRFMNKTVGDYFKRGPRPPRRRLHLKSKSRVKPPIPGEEILKNI